MRESHVVARVTIEEVGPPLEIAGMVLVRISNATRKLTVGVKFEHTESSRNLASSGFVDIDEVPELLEALAYIHKAATQMTGQQRDYTEVSYTTRDNLTIGFFHEAYKQHTFVRPDNVKRAIILSFAAFAEIQHAIAEAQSYVIERRQAWEPQR